MTITVTAKDYLRMYTMRLRRPMSRESWHNHLRQLSGHIDGDLIWSQLPDRAVKAKLVSLYIRRM